MDEAYGRELTTEGQGGSIPLCNVFAETYPDAEIMLMGVEEPKCLIHAPNESVDPSEIENIALAEALFLERYAGRPADDRRAVHRRGLRGAAGARRAAGRGGRADRRAGHARPRPRVLHGYQPTAITERITLLVAQRGHDPAMILPILERPDAEAAPGIAA